MCLHAERATGCLEFERGRLARELGKSRSTLGRCLRELEAKGVCELTAAANQHHRSRLRVRAEYWPYEVVVCQIISTEMSHIPPLRNDWESGLAWATHSTLGTLKMHRRRPLSTTTGRNYLLQ